MAWILLENWSDSQLGRSIADVVEAAIVQRPAITDPHSKFFLGAKAHIVNELRRVIDVVHPWVTEQLIAKGYGRFPRGIRSYGISPR